MCLIFLIYRSHSFNVHTPLKKEKTQDPPIEHDLYATLEEINKGCVKKMKISRRVIQPDGSAKKEDKYVSIAIKPGWKSGTKVTFQKEGDQSRGKIPADIVFLIRDKPHPLFKREGSDLRYTARLTLKQVKQYYKKKKHKLNFYLLLYLFVNYEMCVFLFAIDIFKRICNTKYRHLMSDVNPKSFNIWASRTICSTKVHHHIWTTPITPSILATDQCQMHIALKHGS